MHGVDQGVAGRGAVGTQKQSTAEGAWEEADVI